MMPVWMSSNRRLDRVSLLGRGREGGICLPLEILWPPFGNQCIYIAHCCPSLIFSCPLPYISERNTDILAGSTCNM